VAPPQSQPASRQRWRLVFRRGPVAAELVGRASIDAWQSALIGSGLPLAQLDATGKPRVAFGAPLSAAAEGEAELAEIFLAERVPAWLVRDALAERMPAAHTLLSAEDVWLGAPPLPGQIIAADWRVELEAAGVDRVALAAAADRLLAAASLPRTRQKAGGDKDYDLRPLLDDVRVDPPGADGERLTVRIRTRFRPDLGSGRPEEVVAALAEAGGAELVICRMVRERLLLGEVGSAYQPG
jgi:radical SAM-linked protein